MKDFIHILFAGAVGALAAYFNVLAVPLVVLVAVMLIDYVTGMTAASYTKQLNSRVGVIGIVKKVCYLALVAVGMVVDYLISSALVSIGITMYVIMDDDVVPTDGAVTAESLIIRPNYASVIEGVRLANIDPVVTGVSVQVVTK